MRIFFLRFFCFGRLQHTLFFSIVVRNMNQQTVRTRFAPSPTGNLHVGGVRTALFAYLWAKKHKGQFLLRIEDTDQSRYVEGSLDTIFTGLRWLGLEWDEGPHVGGEFGPYQQSERLDLYAEHAQMLIEQGTAYRCFCTSQRLEDMRAQQQSRKEPPRYDRLCRSVAVEEVELKMQQHVPFVIRLAVPEQGTVTVDDMVRGRVEFDLTTIDDQVLMKSDGFPTYHLANVVDDHFMKITHVIRGEEWLPSTPKHILLYQAFGWTAPAFAHLSIFLSKEGGKMSKRDGATALLQFKDEGYLPAAVVNFLALLGWNPKTEEEFFTLEQLVEKFDFGMVNAANPVFEREKLNWMNQQYLRQLSVPQVVELLQSLAAGGGEHAAQYERSVGWFTGLPQQVQESAWCSLKERAKTLLEVAEVANVALNPVPEYGVEKLVWKKSTTKATIEVLERLMEEIGTIADSEFTAPQLEKRLLNWIASNGWGNGDVLWPMRFALSGMEKSPSPFELAEILQKSEVLNRLRQAITELKTV